MIKIKQEETRTNTIAIEILTKMIKIKQEQTRTNMIAIGFQGTPWAWLPCHI